MPAVLAAALALALMASAAAGAQSILDQVISRDRLVCGIHGSLAGFGNLEPDGSYSGFDVDFCKAIAAAVLGDPNKVEYVPVTAPDRPIALQSGSIDVLIRNTTWTLTRDTEWRADFAPITFYDGQGFMVPKALGITTTAELAGATVCVTAGTTTELNLGDHMRSLGVDFTPLTFESTDTLYNAYDQGRCDAVTADASQLVSARSSLLSNPDDHIILETTISKEPLGPSTIHGDNVWHDVVTWVVYATFFAEEKGITSQNVRSMRGSENPEIRRFLGETGNLGELLGLPNDWAVRVIEAVGNYEEIWNRNLAPLGLPRGLNRQWTDGGLLYAMPFV